jgi:hypothetical protein
VLGEASEKLRAFDTDRSLFDGTARSMLRSRRDPQGVGADAGAHAMGSVRRRVVDLQATAHGNFLTSVDRHLPHRHTTAEQ